MTDVICSNAYDYDWCNTCRHGLVHSEESCKKDDEGKCRMHDCCKEVEE